VGAHNGSVNFSIAYRHIDDDMKDVTYTCTDTDTCRDASNFLNEIHSSVD
jgi:hypothetical protein